jgi:hypothetical protein
MKEIRVPLSVKNLKELTKKFKSFESDIKKSKQEIVEDLLTIADEEIRKGYASSPYEGYEEQNSFKKTKNKASVSGADVIYREFGTGTQGAMDAHPIKDEFSLNPYNSGKTIRTAKDNINPLSGIAPGELYWTFKKNGVLYYTTGIPSGKEVYYASKKTRESIKKVAKERIGGAISKL